MQLSQLVTPTIDYAASLHIVCVVILAVCKTRRQVKRVAERSVKAILYYWI